METLSGIQQIDDGLAIYYESRNVKGYYDDEGNGRFRLWAEDGGMDTDEIKDDLNDDDPLSIEFDDNFPLEREENRNVQIRNILLKCLKETKPFFGKVLQFPDITKEFLVIDPQDLVQMKRQYSNQCASIMNEGMAGDGGLFEIITAGHKQGYGEYIQHLVDTYSRDRIAYYLQYKDSTEYGSCLGVNTWCHLDNSPLFRTLDQFESTSAAVTKTKTAITSFYDRLVPKLMLTGNKKIQDSVENTAAYITSTALFVRDLVREAHTFPFQIDLSIGYKSAREQDEETKPRNNEDEDDDTTDIYGDQKHDDKQGFYDCIGNVKEKLDANDLIHVEDTISQNRDDQKYALGASHRPLKGPFDKLKLAIGSKHYPHRKRVNIFVDRRGENPHVHTVHMFEPPENCRFIPTECAALWYLAASRATLIPDMKYDGDVLDATNAVSPQVIQFVKDADEEKDVTTPTHYWCILAQCVSKTPIKDHAMDGLDFELVVEVRREYYTIKVRRENQPSMKYTLIGNPVETPNFDRSKQRVDKNAIHYKTTKEKLRHQNIKSNDHCKGGLLTVSFHAIEEDRIKCYLYFAGQVTRFIPETDIKDLLPLLFDETVGDNAEWPESDVAQKMAESLSNVIVDREFESFYNKYKSQFKHKKRKDSFIT
eukprot:201159_1